MMSVLNMAGGFLTRNHFGVPTELSIAPQNRPPTNKNPFKTKTQKKSGGNQKVGRYRVVYLPEWEGSTVDGSEIRRSPPGMVYKTL